MLNLLVSLLQGDSGSLPNQKNETSEYHIDILITVSSITYLCIWIDPVTSLSITQTASAQLRAPTEAEVYLSTVSQKIRSKVKTIQNLRVRPNSSTMFDP